jgi:hypothetical protein
MSRTSITITELPSGDLLLAAGNAVRAELKSMREASRYTDVAALHELTEPYWTNGSYAPFDASEGNPFVGLTSAPCIAEDLDYPDDGQRQIIGRFWYFPDYMLRSPIDELIKRGRVVFKQA